VFYSKVRHLIFDAPRCCRVGLAWCKRRNGLGQEILIKTLLMP
jgi:hypothetical protein